MKEKNILSEIQRMREIMGMSTLGHSHKFKINESLRQNGLRLITEGEGGKGGATELVLKALGVSDEVASSTAKKAADEWDAAARNFADVLEREGLDDIGKIQKSLTNVGADASKLTDDVIENSLALYFKNNPDVATAILKEMPGFVDNVLKDIKLTDLGLPPQTVTDLETILSSASEDLTDDMITDLTTIRNTLSSIPGGASIPAVKDTIEGLDLKISLAKGDIKPKADVPADTPVMQKDLTQQGKTQAEIDAENAAKEAEEQAKKEAEERDIQNKKSEEALAKRKNEKIKDAEESLKNDPNWSKAWSLWDKVIRYFGLGKASKYLSQARKTFSEMTLGELQNVTSSSQYRQLVKQLEDRIRAKSKNKKDYSEKIDGLGKILDSLNRLVEKAPILGPIGKIVGGMAVIWILWGLYENVEWINKLSVASGNLAWDVIDNFLSANMEFEITFPDCLSDIDGYWSLTLDQQTMLASTGLSCANAQDETNYATYATNIEFAAGSSVMDPKTKKPIVKPNRFIVTMGGNPVEFPVDGGTTPPTPGTGNYPNTEEGFALWVSEKKTGSVFGIDYVWSDNKGFAGQGTKNADNTYPNYKPLTWKDANTGWE